MGIVRTIQFGPVFEITFIVRDELAKKGFFEHERPEYQKSFRCK
jgi:hypothetical protein